MLSEFLNVAARGEPGNLEAGTLPFVIGNAFWVLLGSATIWWRYRRIEVTR